MATSCEHIEQVSHDWQPVPDAVCEECVREGSDWVALRRCMTCGHIGCCDSSPSRHATAHHDASGHPLIEAVQPPQGWVWCYVDEVTLREVDGDWREVDLFFEAGLGYMREHLSEGGTPDPEPDATMGKGFPIGRWVAEMRRRATAGELTDDQRAKIDALDGWRWDA